VATLPFGINNGGQVVGVYLDLDDPVRRARGFKLENGVFTTIDAPDATAGTVIFDLNNRGRLAGAYNLVQHGFLRDRRGNFTIIDPAEGAISDFVGINNRGQVVGRYVDADGRLLNASTTAARSSASTRPLG
jgi:hypothetical protein